MSQLGRIIGTICICLAMGCTSVLSVDTPERETGSIKLLPIGDSRVEGASPRFESYRYELWKQIIENEISIDLIGPLRDPYRYNSFSGQEFDPDHAGVGGFTTQDVLDNLDDILANTFVPDVVLLGIGGNDLIGTNRTPQATAKNVERIIQRLRDRNPKVKILIEQIAPGQPSLMSVRLTRSFNSFNEEIALLAGNLTSSASPIFVVDMTEDWDPNYLADDVHYNSIGAKYIAQKYFEILAQEF